MVTLVCPLCGIRVRVRNKDLIGRVACPHCSTPDAPVLMRELRPPQEPAPRFPAVGQVVNGVRRLLGLAGG